MFGPSRRLLACAVLAAASAASPVLHAAQQELPMKNQHVRGAFEVKMSPQPDVPVGRMTLDKQYHGALEASAVGQMLAFRTDTEGSAGYVAMEQVTGTLAGRKGSFVLQHSGVMNRGAPNLTITVVPDSGTGELAGLSGTMNIVIEAGGKHFYEFDYSLPASP